MRTCTKCGETKPITEFYRKPEIKLDGTHRYFAQCKKCSNKVQRDYRRENHEQVRIHNTASRIARLQKALVKLSPDGEPKCAVCGFKEDQRLLQIDHIHNNGAIDKLKNGRRKTAHAIVSKIKHMSIEEARSEYQILCVVHNWIKRYGETGENLIITIKPNT